MDFPEIAPADEPETNEAAPTDEAVAEPVAEAVEPKPAGDEPEQPEQPEQPEAIAEPERVVNGLIDGDAPVAMHHPDGGTCDAYETDSDGNLLVPAFDVPAMLSHGFVVAVEG